MSHGDQLGHYLKHLLTCYKSLLNLNERPNTCLIDYFDVAPDLAGMTFLRQQLPLEIRVQMSWANYLSLFLEPQHFGKRA